MRRLRLSLAACILLILSLTAFSHAAQEDQTLVEVENHLKALVDRGPVFAQAPQTLARDLGGVDTIYDYVRDRITFQDYVGRLRGPRGTLQAGAGNALDQSELLVTLLNFVGGKCRYFRGERKAADGSWSDHFWVQVQEENDWRDLDPTFPELLSNEGLLRRDGSMIAIPSNLIHKVHLEVKFRLNDSDKRVERSALERVFDVADLYGKALTLATRFDGRTEEDRFVLEVFQPLLELGDELLPGEMIPEQEGEKPPPAASRLSGVFQQPQEPSGASQASQADLEILAQWVEVQLISPGSPKDRFIYTIFDKEKDGTGDPGVLDGLINAVAFGFSPAPVGEEFARDQLLADVPDIRLMTESLRQISTEDFSPTEPPGHLTPEDRAKINLALEAGNRALAQAILLNYLWRSDEALSDLSAPIEASAYRGMPRAIIASVSFQGDKIRYDLDLRRNPATYELLEGAPVEWNRFLNYHRGLYESRLEGAALMSFTGQPAVTAADVLTAAQEQDVPVRVLVRKNRKELQSLQVGQETKSRINRALNENKTVMLLEHPVAVAGAEHMAWFEFDPRTGYIDGVFPTGKHQAMTEYIMEEIVIIGLVSQATSYLVSSVAGYYLGIAAGLGHFYACLLDLETPNTPCFGTGQVCGPAKADAVMFCTAWKNAQQGFELASGWASADITGMFPWPSAWEELAGEPCARGASSALKIFGCGN